MRGQTPKVDIKVKTIWARWEECKNKRPIMPFNPKFTITPKINKALVEIERVRGFLDAVKLKDEWIADMQREALILESYHSTQILLSFHNVQVQKQ